MYKLIRITEGLTEGQTTILEESFDLSHLERERIALLEEADTSMNLFRIVIECQQCCELFDWEHCHDGICEYCLEDLEKGV